MINEEAKEILEKIKLQYDTSYEEDALDMAIKALEKQLCEDNNAVDIGKTKCQSCKHFCHIKPFKGCSIKECNYEPTSSIKSCEGCKYYPPSKKWACIDCDMTIHDRFEPKIIDEVSNNTKWIPVSERLPETNVEVLVTTEWDFITIGEMFSSNDWFIHEGATNVDIDDIKAWMPLPELYKPESEEKK